jgi:hypothetical protein
MLLRLALFAVLVLGAASPAFADYWIVRAPDRTCMIVDEPPDTSDESIQIVGQQLYVTREAAEEDIAVACRQ